MSQAEQSWEPDKLVEFYEALCSLADTEAGLRSAEQLYLANAWLHAAQLDLLSERHWRRVGSASSLVPIIAASPLSVRLAPGLNIPSVPWKSGALALVGEMIDALGTTWEKLDETQQAIVELFLSYPEGTCLLNAQVADEALGNKGSSADRPIRALCGMGILVRVGSRKGASLRRSAVTGIPKEVLDRASEAAAKRHA